MISRRRHSKVSAAFLFPKNLHAIRIITWLPRCLQPYSSVMKKAIPFTNPSFWMPPFAWLLLCLCLRTQAAESTTTGDDCLTIMTFNLRFASDTPPNAWSQRRPVTRACIEKTAPDVIGTQEGVYSQLKDIAADQPAYAWIGQGREGGSHGEFMAIFYRTNRLEPLEYDHFWLSDTPRVIGSSTWGNTCRRMATWVKFRDLKTGKPFYFVNTHLDHQVELARQKGATLIRERIAALKTELPVILTGDFNADGLTNKAYKILNDDGFLADTWTTAQERRNETYNSFHGYETPGKNGLRIDWILGRGIVKTEWSEVVVFNQDGQYPSDHFPVTARVLLAGKTKP